MAFGGVPPAAAADSRESGQGVVGISIRKVFGDRLPNQGCLGTALATRQGVQLPFLVLFDENGSALHMMYASI